MQRVLLRRAQRYRRSHRCEIAAVETTEEPTAFDLNRSVQNIGARRLHTILERVVEDVSYEGPDLAEKHVVIDEALVRERLETLSQDEDLSRFIL